MKPLRPWTFSLILLGGYCLTFLGWLHLPERAHVPLWLGAVTLLAAAHWKADKAGYFANRWDGWFHSLVILDLFLEGLLDPLFKRLVRSDSIQDAGLAQWNSLHDGYGFLLCALAFTVFVGGYRAAALRKG